MLEGEACGLLNIVYVFVLVQSILGIPRWFTPRRHAFWDLLGYAALGCVWDGSKQRFTTISVLLDIEANC
jgi:hypothetical protein